MVCIVLLCQKYIPCVSALSSSSDVTMKAPPMMPSGHSGLLPGVLHGQGHSSLLCHLPKDTAGLPLRLLQQSGHRGVSSKQT